MERIFCNMDVTLRRASQRRVIGVAAVGTTRTVWQLIRLEADVQLALSVVAGGPRPGMRRQTTAIQPDSRSPACLVRGEKGKR